MSDLHSRTRAKAEPALIVPIKALVFDWGGVLMRTVDYGPRHRWDDRLGLPHGSVEQAVHGLDVWRQAQLGELSIDAYWQGVGDHLGLAPARTAKLRVDFYSGDRVDGRLVSAIHRWRGKSLKIGLLSNYTSDLVELLKSNQLDTLFDGIAISADIKAMKPEAAAYNAVLDRLGVAAAEAVIVDDVPANIDGARAIGMSGVLFTLNNSWEAELQDLIEAS